MLLLNLSLALIAATKSLVFVVQENEKAIANQRVILISTQGEQIEEKLTNASGLVRFQVDTKLHPYVAAGSIYQEVPYISNSIDTRQASTQPVPLLVYPSSSNNKGLFIDEMDVYMQLQGDELRVHQGFKIVNPDPHSVIPNSNTPVFSFEVPAQAFNFTYERGFTQSDVKNEGNQVQWVGALYPGERYFSFSYSVDSPRVRVQLPQKFSVPILSFSLLSNSEKIRGQEPDLEFLGKKFYDGQLLNLFRVENLNRSEFNLTVKGLPWNIHWYWWLPFLLSFLCLFIIIFSPKRPEAKTKAEDSHKLFEEWLYLQRLKGQNLLSEREYRERSILLLEDLFPVFEEKNANSKSSVQA